MLLFLCLFFMYGVSGTEMDEYESVSVMEGDSVTLHTNLSEVLNDDTILWLFGPKDSLISKITRKGDFTSFSVNNEDMGFRGRLQVDENTGSLTIGNTRIRHSGQYKLSISRKKTTIKIFNVTVSDMVGETEAVKTVSVTEGTSVTLHTDAEMHKDALMLWRFGDEGILLAKIDVETKETSLNNADERFRGRLKLDQTGSLTITNTRITDSGLYELQIRGSESSQRFILSVTDPRLSSGAIAGIVFGVLVPVLLLVAAAFGLIYYRHRISKLKRQMAVTCEEKEETVTEGESFTLLTGLTQIQSTDTIEWCYEAEDNLIAEINGETRRTLPGADGRFRSKLMLDETTGNLTINNIRTIHSGLYKLKINNDRRTIYSLAVNVSSMSVKEGGPALLQTGVEIQPGDLILWTFGAENSLVVKADSRTPDITNERFRDRLNMNQTTGSLTIRNIRPADSGHYKLQIINTEQTTFRRFNVTVTDSSGGRVNEPVTEESPLLNEDVPDGEDEQQSSV
ncbi:hypothetical protein R3I94_017895 [Phoxinus phoxinus]